MGMGFAPTWLRQVSPPLLHKTTLTTTPALILRQIYATAWNHVVTTASPSLRPCRLQLVVNPRSIVTRRPQQQQQQQQLAAASSSCVRRLSAAAADAPCRRDKPPVA